MLLMRRTLLVAGIGVLGAMAPACTGDARDPSGPDAIGPQMLSMAGPGLSANTSAMGFWNRRQVYDWRVSMTLLDETTAEVLLAPGEQVDVIYRVTFTKVLVDRVITTGVAGHVCARNEGASPTQNLRIVQAVHESTDGGATYALLTSPRTVDVSERSTLEPAEEHCYPYIVKFMPQDGSTYRNVATVTADNFETAEGGYPFVMPAGPDLLHVDAQADITAVVTCPAGFTCAPIVPATGLVVSGWVWMNQASSFATNLRMRVTNNSALCGTAELVEKLRLQEHDLGGTTSPGYGGDTRGKVVKTVLNAGPCPTSPCTLQYWQTGDGRMLWNRAADVDWQGARAQPYFTGTMFASVFTTHAAVNGMTMLQVMKGGSARAIMAARSVVTAYLNASYSTAYPWTPAALSAKWDAAVAGSDADLLALQRELVTANNHFDCTQQPN